MSKPSYGNQDPIFALATPLAESALALIRLSGSAQSNYGDGGAGVDAPGVFQFLGRIFSKTEKLASAPPNSVIHGWILAPLNSTAEEAAAPRTAGSMEKIDEVLVAVYRAPASYTGEDGADISCHGGIATVKAVMAALKKAGFREALPGEFTFRAFMNGKLDLTRAESVMELVAAKTNRGREQAVRRLAGFLEKEISAIKTLLVEVLAGTEIFLDYSEDEFLDSASDEETGRLPERKLAEQAAERLKILSQLWQRERIYTEGALAVLAGRPNAGKSSLFNYLIREDRSIVTDLPGTTRDWIDALISVEDIPLRLADTAGLDGINHNGGVSDSATGSVPEKDIAEQIGIKRTLELLDRADLVLYVIDGLNGFTFEDSEFILRIKKADPAKLILFIWNKADLAPLHGQLLGVSAKTGQGMPELLHSIAGMLEAASGSREVLKQDAAGPGTIRQKELIDTALASTEEALVLADNGGPLDIIAPLFRSAINALGEITGEVSTAEILETMFSRFCVGK